MLRGLVVSVLVLGLWGCGDESEVAELTTYVKAIQKFHPYNDKVQFYLANLGDPAFDLKEQDVIDARQLLEDYAAAVDGV